MEESWRRIKRLLQYYSVYAESHGNRWEDTKKDIALVEKVLKPKKLGYDNE